MGEHLEDRGLLEAYRNLECPLSLPLLRMQQQGFPLLLHPLQQLLNRGAHCLRLLQEATVRLLGRPFVISDCQALRNVLLQTPDVMQVLLADACASSSGSENRVSLSSVPNVLPTREIPSLLRRMQSQHPLLWVLCCYRTLQPLQHAIAAVAAAAASPVAASITMRLRGIRISGNAGFAAPADTAAHSLRHHPLCSASEHPEPQKPQQECSSTNRGFFPRIYMCHVTSAMRGWEVSLRLPGAVHHAVSGVTEAARTRHILNSMQQQTLHEELLLLQHRLQQPTLENAARRSKPSTDTILQLLLHRGEQQYHHQQPQGKQPPLPEGLSETCLDVYIHPTALQHFMSSRQCSSATGTCGSQSGKLLWIFRGGQRGSAPQSECEYQHLGAGGTSISWMAAVQLYPAQIETAETRLIPAATDGARTLLLPASLLFRMEAPFRVEGWMSGIQQQQQQEQLAALPPVGLLDVRSVVGSAEGFVLVAVELQHIELRVVAHLSGYAPLVNLLLQSSKRPETIAPDGGVVEKSAAATAATDVLDKLNVELLRLLKDGRVRVVRVVRAAKWPPGRAPATVSACIEGLDIPLRRQSVKASSIEVTKAALLAVCNSLLDAQDRHKLLQKQEQLLEAQGEHSCCRSLSRETPACLPLLLLRDGFLVEATADGLEAVL
ncbi:uncharacterized protein LOC34617631 [Cyclospora cayetanensis]|uniref:Uncharacterized protein LOC34617631 n=1 Tax=Cyclospora cayetanensis TaxID=88456 RepID=A0A6P6RUH0_9EIME|nr:uncharacterized protein LOC34617631 [Cyclospora cayetanensis]